MQEDLKRNDDVGLLKKQAVRIANRLKKAHDKKEGFSHVLEPFRSDDTKPLSYSIEISALIHEIKSPEISVPLEYGDISVKSIGNIISHINQIKTKLSKSQRPNINLPALESIQNELIKYQDTGVRLTQELESSLNASVSLWQEKLDAPTQNITCEGVATIKSQLPRFESAVLQKCKQIEELEEKLQHELDGINVQIDYLVRFNSFFAENEDQYLTVGLPPSHQVFMPFNVNGKCRLSPLAMLQKMYELTKPDAEQFDLYRQNCSLTAMDVLKAGTKHDQQLYKTMDNRALGFFGTPQQVLANAENTREFIDQDTREPLFTKISNLNYLEQALSYAIKLYMDNDGHKMNQAASIMLGILIGLATLPFIVVKALINPIKASNRIIDTLKLVLDRDSSLLKVGLLIVSLPALAFLSPLSIIQAGLNLVSKSFQYFYDVFNKKVYASTDVIDTPIGSQAKTESGPSFNSNNTALAGLVDRKIYGVVSEHTMTISPLKNPQQIVDEFEKLLLEHPEKVVVLSEKSHANALRYFLNSDDQGLKQRFYICCNTSIKRVQQYMPKNRDDVDRIVQEVSKPGYITEKHRKEDDNVEAFSRPNCAG